MSLIASISRQPRYLILLAGTIIATFVVLSHVSTSSISTTVLRPYGSTSLQEVLADSELHYKVNLARREELVRRYGPTAKDVPAFPTPPRDDFYTLWDFFLPAFDCPHRRERVGAMGDGGKWMCGIDRVAKQTHPCVVYSFGINGESAFEEEVLERAPNCQIWGYDFSVTGWGPEISQNPALAQRSHFYPYALGPKDGRFEMWGIDAPMYSLQTLMQKNGHEFIDILKVDVEGSEFEALASFVDYFISDNAARHPHAGAEPVLPVGQLQIEIHARDSAYAEFANFKRWFEKLEEAGLRPFMAEPNLVYVNLVDGVKPTLSEYAFMNIRGNHALVSDKY